MARAAVLVPCQSDSAEVLPEDVSAGEVLQGPLLSAKLNDCRSLHWSAASSNFQIPITQACRDTSLQAQLLMQSHLL
ncbi:hypothetical protein WJX77_004466 [Trebouxia sp. C0004]